MDCAPEKRRGKEGGFPKTNLILDVLQTSLIYMYSYPLAVLKYRMYMEGKERRPSKREKPSFVWAQCKTGQGSK